MLTDEQVSVFVFMSEVVSAIVPFTSPDTLQAKRQELCDVLKQST